MIRLARLLSVLLLFVVAFPPCTARAQYGDEPLDHVTLVDGSVVYGRIVVEDENSITIESHSLGRLVIAKSEAVRIYRADSSFDARGWQDDPDYNTIMLVPTPETLPAGSGYFREFELFFMNFGMGITDDLNLSFATLFPVSSSTLMVGGGGKLRLLSREKFPLGLALVGNATILEDTDFGTAGAVVGVGDIRKSLNLSLQKAFSDAEDSGWMLLAGADIQFSERTKLIVEYATNTQFIDDEDISGLINVGVRFFGERMSFTLTGFRPLTDEESDLLFFPLAMYSMHW
jgi:hypothetical protein